MTKTFPLTLNRILKAPTQGEEVERTRNIKRATTELPKETVLTIEEEPEREEMGEEEPEREEMGGGGGEGVEDYLKQPVLSPKNEEEIPAQKRAEEKESSASELLSLLTEMREYMKRRNE